MSNILDKNSQQINASCQKICCINLSRQPQRQQIFSVRLTINLIILKILLKHPFEPIYVRIRWRNRNGVCLRFTEYITGLIEILSDSEMQFLFSPWMMLSRRWNDTAAARVLPVIIRLGDWCRYVIKLMIDTCNRWLDLIGGWFHILALRNWNIESQSISNLRLQWNLCSWIFFAMIWFSRMRIRISCNNSNINLLSNLVF